MKKKSAQKHNIKTKSRVLSYKRKPMLVLVSTSYTKNNNFYRTTFLLTPDGAKIHTLDDFCGIKDFHATTIKHTVKCYDTFFVVNREVHRQSRFDDRPEVSVNSTAYDYGGLVVMTTSGKWNEAQHYMQAKRASEESSKDLY